MKVNVLIFVIILSVAAAFSFPSVSGGRCSSFSSTTRLHATSDRRQVLFTASALLASGVLSSPLASNAAAAAIQDSLDVESFIRTGVDIGGNMGVSSQAGKSKPETGVIFRDGSDVLQNPKTGAVAAEILVGLNQSVLVSFESASQWKLEKGSVFDIECRDSKTGDGAFVAVTQQANGKALAELPDDFFLDRLFSPTGRFSLYGPPTDITVKRSKMDGNRRYLDVSFSTLSQSTNAEIPRRALIVATMPTEANRAVMLVGSSTSSRWRKGADQDIEKVVSSFTAVSAPKSSLKLRPKERGGDTLML
jgi:hypothetical protein